MEILLLCKINQPVSSLACSGWMHLSDRYLWMEQFKNLIFNRWHFRASEDTSRSLNKEIPRNRKTHNSNVYKIYGYLLKLGHLLRRFFINPSWNVLNNKISNLIVPLPDPGAPMIKVFALLPLENVLASVTVTRDLLDTLVNKLDSKVFENISES